ncbi:MAG: helix-turn-helix transcriptional regulator [Coleofasciculaceae cyanobacterium SM2_3_26]|nr:helix-turn-helix transcriptional regulator [Coleofasciculaceae cyanobacterium SM2_3_26]
MKPLYHPEREAMTLEGTFSALGDSVRLNVVRELLRLPEDAEKSCGTFEIPVSKSTFSHHVRVLREAGLIRVRQEGALSLLSLRREDLEARFPGLLTTVAIATKKQFPRRRVELIALSGNN